MTIRNPIEWTTDQLRLAVSAVGAVAHAGGPVEAARPEIRHIGLGDLPEVLRRGLDDFAARRTDVVFLCVIYPVVGLILARLAFGYGLLPLLFPLASGFALIGPAAAVGLYEISRRRERGLPVALPDAFAVVRSHSFGAITALGLLLVAIFILWLIVASLIYDATLGPAAPESVAGFIGDVITTGPGWVMIAAGIGAGFVFALVVLAIGTVSFPLLLDRDVGFGPAIATSVRAVLANPGPLAVWGLIVAGGLVLGSIPLLLGMVVVMPVLGHATWHLYRKLVSPG